MRASSAGGGGSHPSSPVEAEEEEQDLGKRPWEQKNKLDLGLSHALRGGSPSGGPGVWRERERSCEPKDPHPGHGVVLDERGVGCSDQGAPLFLAASSV